MGDPARLSVVVTRAAHQADELCELIEKAGGEAIRFPVTKIEAVDDYDPALAQSLEALNELDVAIFVSPNAATYGLSLLKRRGRDFAERVKVLAVGPGTGRQLHERGVKVSAIPQDKYDSESLLALPDLQEVAGRSVLIIRGQAGREMLAEELARRQAVVSHLVCYRRVALDNPDLNVLNRWRHKGFDLLILTSASAADHLWQLLGAKAIELLKNMTLVVSSERIGKHCRSLGFAGSIVVAENAGMPALVSALE
jgi:uroporphyrinogen-III synthase